MNNQLLIIGKIIFCLLAAAVIRRYYLHLFGQKPVILSFIIISAVIIIFYFYFSSFEIPGFFLLGIFFTLFTMMSLDDIKDKTVPLLQIIGLAATAGIIRFFINPDCFLNLFSMASAIIVSLIIIIIGKNKSMGPGDIAVLIILSPLLEAGGFFFMLFLSAFSGIIYFLIKKLLGKKEKSIPFLPFLEIAFFIIFPNYKTITAFFMNLLSIY